ncbi:MAG: Lon protease family protein [Chitinivibrionales bacterium]
MTSENGHIRKLSAADVDLVIDEQSLGFSSTDQLDALDEIVGQPRALKALDLGLGIRKSGYNIYASGINGMGRKALIQRALLPRIDKDKTPSDWVYVNNFEQEDRPFAISLPAGKGLQLRKDMEKLVARLKEDLPRAFREEDFSRERQRLGIQYEKHTRELFEELKSMAAQKGLSVQQGSQGQVFMVPMKDDKPMSDDDFEQLSDEQKEDIAKRQQEVGEMAGSIFSKQREMERKLSTDIREVERNFASRIIVPAISEVAGKYESQKLREWFEEARNHMIDNLDRFRGGDGQSQQQQLAQMIGGATQAKPDFTEYEVNVVVDNSKTRGAPVIIEESPNYKNMFGTIYGALERSGRMITGFSHIKAGSLLRANGGYLVFDLMEALREPLVWKELKRTIKSGELEYHMYDPFGVFATTSLKPEAIKLDVKLVAIGSPLVYYLLQLYDEDFKEIFKVKADFATEIDRDEGIDAMLGKFIQKLRKEDDMPAFTADGIAELARIGARLAGDKTKLTAEFSRLADLASEASFWAMQDQQQQVNRFYVRKAIEEKVYRSNLIAVRIEEMITEDVLLISTEGQTTGQINGLSVVKLGDYAFGRPSRLTASVGLGTAGIINIERESRLSGRSYDKAMLILEGYLRNVYAGNHPLALSASIAMEQSYGPIEGDSATITELVCLLSAIGQIPLRQDIAITGSVNQWGQVQAVGGVNEKVEGFFDVCKAKGLTGKQGVCLPGANIRNLVLRHDVVDAVSDGRFHVWAADTVDQALELMCSVPAGNINREDSIHWKVARRLEAMAHTIREQKAITSIERELALASSDNGKRDPRPGLPGRDEQV